MLTIPPLITETERELLQTSLQTPSAYSFAGIAVPTAMPWAPHSGGQII